MIEQLATLQDVDKLYDWFTEMRRQQPVWLDEESNCWHAFRYDDILNITTNPTQFSSERSHRVNKTLRRPEAGRSLIAMDPPEHRLYRDLVSPSFTPRALARLTDRIKEITQELIDQVRAQGSLDMVADIAYPLPTIVISELLGVPLADRPLFKSWADSLFSRQLSDVDLFNSDEKLDAHPSIVRSQQAFDEMQEYFKHMLAERARSPRDDMMTQLQQAEVNGQHLDEQDFVNFCVLLLLAGHVTTTNLIQQAILCLDEHPDARAELQEKPELMPKAIEEVLRYSSPVWRLLRTTKEEVTLGNQQVPEGAIVFCWLASANRDETQFEQPERFDIHRSPNRHVAFGHGIHFCVGAPLARLETNTALPMILQQLPDLHVRRDRPLLLQDSRILFGFKQMPMSFSA